MEPEQNKENLHEIKSEVVTFFEDGEVATVPSGNVRPEPFYLKPAEDTLENSVIGFLSRPIEQQNLLWNLADVKGTQVGNNLDLPAAWMQNSMISEKLAGIRFIRCKFRVKIQFNAQKFNAGMLVAFFEPLASQQSFRPSNAAHFGGITGYDPVFLDISDSTSMELLVPFCANVTHYDMITGDGLAGQVRIYVYSQLTGGTDSIDGTMWVTAEDVDVQMATGVSALPRAFAQSGLTSGAGAGITSSRAAGNSTQISPDNEKSAGSVEALARKIGSVASSASSVPVVSIPARTLSYVADAAAGVASIFGWSRPTDDSFATPMVPCYIKNFTNFNGDSKSKVLALDARNEVRTPCDVFGTEVDEMSFAHILRKKSWMTFFSIDKTAVANQVVWKWPVTPDACLRVPVGTHAYKLNTYLSYHAENFYSWRGGINYHFKVVKSQFHTCRIRVSYVSGLLYNSSLTTIDINRVYSRIYDIRDLTEFEFVVPYVYNAPWASLNSALGGEISPYTDTVPTGVVLVEVINALRCPDTCAPNIEFIVSTSAAEDFQFAIPTQSDWGINTDTNFLTGSGFAVGNPDVLSEKLSLSGPRKRTMKSHFSHLFEDMNDIPVERGINPVLQTPKQYKLYRDSKKKVVPSLAETPKALEAELDAVTTQVETKAPLLLPSESMDFYRSVTDDYWRKFVEKVDKVDALDSSKARFIAAFIGVYEDTAVADRPDLEELVVDPQLIPLVTIVKHNSVLVPESGEPQSGDLIVPGPVDTGHAINAFGMGEVVTGWRQILKRYDGLGFVIPTSTPGPTQIIGMYPADMGIRYPMSANPAMFTTYNVMFNRAAVLYRYWCGSIRISMYRNSGTQSTQQWRWSPTTTMLVPASAAITTFPVVNQPVRPVVLNVNSFSNAGLPRSIYFPNTEEVTEVLSPFYERYPAVPTQLGGMDYVDIGTTGSVLNKNPCNFGSLLAVLTSNGLEFNRAIGEDFSFGYLVGPPITRRPLIPPPSPSDGDNSSQIAEVKPL
jgi:hypothetical protein